MKTASYSIEVIVNIFQILVFVLLIIIFHGRAKKLMNYKARMLMEVYDVCKDCNDPEQESFLERKNNKRKSKMHRN